MMNAKEPWFVTKRLVELRRPLLGNRIVPGLKPGGGGSSITLRSLGLASLKWPTIKTNGEANAQIDDRYNGYRNKVVRRCW
jgi:hypothetical protein